MGDFPGPGKADRGIGPQPYVPAPSKDYNSLDPRFAPRRGDVEVEAVAVAVPAGFAKVFAESAVSLAMLPLFPSIFPHLMWDVMVFYGSLGERSRLRCHQPSYVTGLFETLWGRTSHQFDGDKLTMNG